MEKVAVVLYSTDFPSCNEWKATAGLASSLSASATSSSLTASSVDSSHNHPIKKEKAAAGTANGKVDAKQAAKSSTSTAASTVVAAVAGGIGIGIGNTSISNPSCAVKLFADLPDEFLPRRNVNLNKALGACYNERRLLEITAMGGDSGGENFTYRPYHEEVGCLCLGSTHQQVYAPIPKSMYAKKKEYYRSVPASDASIVDQVDYWLWIDEQRYFCGLDKLTTADLSSLQFSSTAADVFPPMFSQVDLGNGYDYNSNLYYSSIFSDTTMYTDSYNNYGSSESNNNGYSYSYSSSSNSGSSSGGGGATNTATATATTTTTGKATTPKSKKATTPKKASSEANSFSNSTSNSNSNSISNSNSSTYQPVVGMNTIIGGIGGSSEIDQLIAQASMDLSIVDRSANTHLANIRVALYGSLKGSIKNLINSVEMPLTTDAHGVGSSNSINSNTMSSNSNSNSNSLGANSSGGGHPKRKYHTIGPLKGAPTSATTAATTSSAAYTHTDTSSNNGQGQIQEDLSSYHHHPHQQQQQNESCNYYNNLESRLIGTRDMQILSSEDGPILSKWANYNSSKNKKAKHS